MCSRALSIMLFVLIQVCRSIESCHTDWTRSMLCRIMGRLNIPRVHLHGQVHTPADSSLGKLLRHTWSLCLAFVMVLPTFISLPFSIGSNAHNGSLQHFFSTCTVSRPVEIQNLLCHIGFGFCFRRTHTIFLFIFGKHSHSFWQFRYTSSRLSASWSTHTGIVYCLHTTILYYYAACSVL